MSAELRVVEATDAVRHDECDRLDCHREHGGRVILADSARVSRQLCRYHRKSFIGGSS